MARRDVRFARKSETAGLSTDHGGLTGLTDDDHTQYHTDARALTWLQAQNVSELTNDAGYLTGVVLTDLGDVNSSTPTNRNVLVADGVDWESRALVEADISDLGTYLTSVAVSDLDNGTDGELITWDASGVATTVAVGTAGQVLTSNGVGAAPTFQAAAGGGLSDVVDDATPQLGGNLDVNGNSIVSVSNGDITLSPNGTGNVLLEYAGSPLLYVQSGGLRIRSDGSSADIEFADSANTQIGRLVATSSSFSFGANGHGATVSITGESSGGVARFLFLGDPDGDFQIYNAGNITLESDTLGINIRDTSGDNPLLKMQSSAGVDAGWLYFGASGTGGYLRNFQNGMNFRLLGNNAGGTTTTGWEFDPDGGLDLYYDGDITGGTAVQGMRVNAPTGDPILRFQENETQRAQMFYDISANEMKLRTIEAASAYTLQVRNTGDTAYVDGVSFNDTQIGFLDAAPVTPPTYTVTNDLTDRTFDANTVATAELADVVATIIADLQANGLFQ